MNINTNYNLNYGQYNQKTNRQAKKQSNPNFGIATKKTNTKLLAATLGAPLAMAIQKLCYSDVNQDTSGESQYVDTKECNDFNHEYIVRKYTSGPLAGHRQTLELDGKLVKHFCPDGRILAQLGNILHIRFSDNTTINIKDGDIIEYLNTEGKNQKTAQDVIDARYTKERQQELKGYITKSFSDSLFHVKGATGYYEILDALEKANELYPEK